MVATGFESRPSAVGEGREGCDPAGAAGITWCIQVDMCGVGRSSREHGETWPGDAELYPVGAGKQKVTSLLYINSGSWYYLGSNINFSAERNPKKWLTLNHEPHPGDPTQTLSFVSQVPSLPHSHRFSLLHKDVIVKGGLPGPSQTSLSTTLPNLNEGAPTLRHSTLNTGSGWVSLTGAPHSCPWSWGPFDGPVSWALGHEGGPARAACAGCPH